MKCNKAARMLPALVAGELDPDAAGAIERHLAECPACSASKVGFEADRALLREMPLPEPGPGLLTRVMASVSSDRSEERVQGFQDSRVVSSDSTWRTNLVTGPSDPRTLFLRRLAAAAMALLVAGGVWTGANLGAELAQRYSDHGADPLTVDDAPSLTEYVDTSGESGQ